MMLYWIYHNEICLLYDSYYYKTGATHRYVNSGIGLLVQLFVLGQKYQMPTLSNDAIDAIYLWIQVKRQIPTNVLSYGWENTLPKSPLRLLLAEQVKVHLGYKDLEKIREDLNFDFWADLSLGYHKTHEERMEAARMDKEFLEPLLVENFCELLQTHDEQGTHRGCHGRKHYSLY
jgi:hypothetical protein